MKLSKTKKIILLDSKKTDEESFLFLNNLKKKLERQNKDDKKRFVNNISIAIFRIKNKKKMNPFYLIKFRESINNEKSRFNAR